MRSRPVAPPRPAQEPKAAGRNDRQRRHTRGEHPSGDGPGQAERAGPDFARNFPDDPALSLLLQAFERGNYAMVRREAEQLAERAPSQRVQQAARELRRRIDPDPMAKYLLALACLLLAFLVIWVYGHRP